METYATPGGDAYALPQLQSTARETSTWLKILGIVNIVFGVPLAIVLVGLLNIWLGWLLYKAGDHAATASGADLVAMFERLRTYFIVQAILAILGVVVFIIYIVVILFVGVAIFQEGGGFDM